MNERDFCYWLKGYLELTYQQHLTNDQVSVIKEHLDLVFDKKTALLIDPSNIADIPEGMEKTIFGLQKQRDIKVVPANHIEKGTIQHLTC